MKTFVLKLRNPLLALLCCQLCWCGGLFAQEESSKSKPDPIDQQVDKLMEADPSTGGSVQAYAQGVKLWDAEMNKTYQNLLELLPAKEKETLKKAQRDWLAFRDSNLGLIRTVYTHPQGTMYRPMAVSAEMEVVKTRAIQLRNLLEIMRESKED